MDTNRGRITFSKRRYVDHGSCVVSRQSRKYKEEWLAENDAAQAQEKARIDQEKCFPEEAVLAMAAVLASSESKKYKEGGLEEGNAALELNKNKERLAKVIEQQRLLWNLRGILGVFLSGVVSDGVYLLNALERVSHCIAFATTLTVLTLLFFDWLFVASIVIGCI